MRRYNKPKQYEPVVVFYSPDGAPPANRDIAVWPREVICREEPEHRDLPVWPRETEYSVYRVHET